MTIELGPRTLALDGTSLPEKSLIGGKAWSVARMRGLGLPVPPAFVITTQACAEYLATGALPAGLLDELEIGVQWLEKMTGRVLGSDRAPLLLSVRSGAMVSMPGMMDTILNLGMNSETAVALARETGDAAFASDTHRRFLELYARIVLRGTLPELAADAPLANIESAIIEATGMSVPEEPRAQLAGAVQAVFESWNSRRARRYRDHHQIPHTLGTAVTVQAMVFGNLDADSGTGVLFSRNPLTGAADPFGEYLARAQGEDVVSGRFTPRPLSALAESAPDIHRQLLAAAARLEAENGDVQDIEFTVQQGQLYLLQTRTAKRAPAAAVRFAVDMVHEGRIDEATALSRVTAEQIRVLLSPRLAPGATDDAVVVAGGEAACQGIGTGVVVINTDEAERRAQAGEKVILARDTTSPDDVHGMLVAHAVITEQGGTTSHAALVCRDIGVPCVVGCGPGNLMALVGQVVTVDGGAGRVYAGDLSVIAPDERTEPGLAALAVWAAVRAPLQVFEEAAPEAKAAQDLDRMRGGEDPEQLAALAAGALILRGAVLNSDKGVAAAVAAGVKAIVVKQRLPALLAALGAVK